MRTSWEIDPTQWPELWQAAYRILQQNDLIIESQLRAWVRELVLLKAEEKDGNYEIVMGAPNEFTSNWVRDKYAQVIESAFAQVTGLPCKVTYIVRHEDDRNTGENPQQPLYIEAPQSHVQNSNVVLSHGSRPANDPHLDPRYTFETYVVGASNQFAYASSVAVAEQPAKQYNPLFIYSQPGLGKTHLLHAIGNHILAKNPNFRVAYLSAERFVNELVDSLQHNRMSQFRNKFRDGFDLVLIDDIQFIAGKVKTEEEFFHTFNALHGSKRQIVVTSDRPPKEIANLEERVRTRFEWGLVVDISPPEIETRIAIIKSKAERDDIYVPDELATFLATYIKSNVRELEGVLVRLQAEASLTGANISLEMAKNHLKTSLPTEGTVHTVESIQNAVAKHFRIKIIDLKSSSRIKTVSLPRQIAMFLIRKYTGLGFKEIGSHFAGKDHSTVLHACQKIEGALESVSEFDPHFSTEIVHAVEAIQNTL